VGGDVIVVLRIDVSMVLTAMMHQELCRDGNVEVVISMCVPDVEFMELYKIKLRKKK